MAIFTITRANTSEVVNGLTVFLAVGGTAEFGVDYTVSGAESFTATTASVVIPAGDLSVSITATAVADNAIEFDETVILSIVPELGVIEVGVNADATWSILTDDLLPPLDLLLRFEGANNSTVIVDSSPVPKALTAFGGAKISTAESKFGGSSLSFPGLSGNNYVRIANSPALELGALDFTIEFWYFARAGSTNFEITKGYNGYGGTQAAVTFSTNGDIRLRGKDALNNLYYFASFNIYTGSFPSGWVHLAMTRQGDVLRVFRNGILVGSEPNLNGGSVYDNSGLGGAFGLWEIGLTGGYCYVDGLSMIVGTCLYDVDFVPPAGY